MSCSAPRGLKPTAPLGPTEADLPQLPIPRPIHSSDIVPTMRRIRLLALATLDPAGAGPTLTRTTAEPVAAP